MQWLALGSISWGLYMILALFACSVHAWVGRLQIVFLPLTLKRHAFFVKLQWLGNCKCGCESMWLSALALG